MDRRPSYDEWKESLLPFLAQIHKRSARRKLCRMHKDGPVKESKIQCPGEAGGTMLATISADSLKFWLVYPDGSSLFMESNAAGNTVQNIRRPPVGPLC